MWSEESVTFKVTGSQRDLRAALKEAALSPGGICDVIPSAGSAGAPRHLPCALCLVHMSPCEVMANTWTARVLVSPS